MTPLVAARPGEPGLFLALAPMDGVTCTVYRELVTELGSRQAGISLCVSEFVRVTDNVVPDHVLLRHCPELQTRGETRAGVPVWVQLLGGEPQMMAQTAMRAVALGARGIDINFGCPAKKVNRHDGGAAILRTPQRIRAITHAVRHTLPRDIPVSAKVRLGWSCSSEVVQIVKAAEEGGASWVTVHARTRVQGYRPPVEWGAIARARAAVGVPVVANGDIASRADVQACAHTTGCTAFMLGRGVMGRPHVFDEVHGMRNEALDMAAMRALLIEYVQRLVTAGYSCHAALGRLKQWLRLAAPAHPRWDAWFQAAKTANTLPAALARLSA